MKTIVSLTFDDGHASHYQAAQLMRERGMAGTFYINSGLVGSSSYYMPWWQVYRIADDGNEIGGHTLRHVNLAEADAATVRTEVCDDRTALINQGFSPVSAFAYPTVISPLTKQITEECGYSSARGVGGLQNSQCPACSPAESLPPTDPYQLRTASGARTTTTLADLQAAITRAEANGGGWVTLAFHGICEDQCTTDLSTSTATFGALLDWLGPRSADGTVVRTVGQAMSGDGPSSSSGPLFSCR